MGDGFVEQFVLAESVAEFDAREAEAVSHWVAMSAVVVMGSSPLAGTFLRSPPALCEVDK